MILLHCALLVILYVTIYSANINYQTIFLSPTPSKPTTNQILAKDRVISHKVACHAGL
jgi:hypothetical protein